MGTNFYWHVPPGESSLELRDLHIGKRSAAGLFCWDCEVTLCEGGPDGIHTGRYGMLDRCPKCGQLPTPHKGMSGPAAVELGFAKASVERPGGVSGTSSFSWAEDPEHVGAICEKTPDDVLVEDEYGRLLTGRQFLDMLKANCRVQFTRYVGQVFS